VLCMCKPTKTVLKVWDEKLKASGFVDIEGSIEKSMTSRSCYNDGRLSTARRRQYFLENEAYFNLAGQFLHSHEFVSPEQKAIWELHSQNFSSKYIAQNTGIYNKTVLKVIKELSALMLSLEDDEDE
jgi:DNA-binding NarL/FixJ family response regulator